MRRILAWWAFAVLGVAACGLAGRTVFGKRHDQTLDFLRERVATTEARRDRVRRQLDARRNAFDATLAMAAHQRWRHLEEAWAAQVDGLKSRRPTNDAERSRFAEELEHAGQTLRCVELGYAFAPMPERCEGCE